MSISEHSPIQLIITCPHCNECIIIAELNCCIFRHGVFKSSGEQIPPHSPKTDCDEYVKQGIIYGCGKPFQIICGENGVYSVQTCDYI